MGSVSSPRGAAKIGQETRVGFAVVGVLFVLFVGVVLGRFTRDSGSNVDLNINTSEVPGEELRRDDNAKTRLVRPPTIVRKGKHDGPLRSPTMELTPGPADDPLDPAGTPSFLPVDSADGHPEPHLLLPREQFLDPRREEAPYRSVLPDGPVSPYREVDRRPAPLRSSE